MSYSSIEKKKCKCGCHRYPSMGYNGYSFKCAPQEIKDKVGTKAQVARKNRNKRMAMGRKLHEVQNVVSNAEKERWHQERRKEAKGVCVNCGGKSCKDSDVYFRFSNAHILPKEFFKSVRTHPLNCIELCYFGNGCHPQMDNKLLDLTEMACWDEIVTKFVAIYPDIAVEERRRIPDILLEYVKTET